MSTHPGVTVADGELYAQPAGSALFTTLLGLGLLLVGVPIVLNWRRAAEHYTSVVDVLRPFVIRLKFMPVVDENRRRRSLVRQQRIIFAVIALFGVFFFSGGVVSLLRLL